MSVAGEVLRESATVQPLGLHASAVLIGEQGVILRGPSGCGKSALALALIQAAPRDGRFGRLVADDRLMVRRAGGRLVVAPHPLIAGQVERRFVGIADIPHEAVAVAALVVDLVSADIARLPDEAAGWTTIAGVRLPRVRLPANHPGAGEVVLYSLRKHGK